MTYVETDSRLKIISWGSVIAGAVTVLAITFALSLAVSWLGLGVVDVDSNDPLAGVGTTFGWASAAALIISLAAGGYIAGYLSGVAGWVHGFLTWAVALIVAAIISFSAVGGIIGATGNVVGSIANVTGSAASATGSAVSSVASAITPQVDNLINTLDEQVLDDIDQQEATATLRRALSQVELSELEPDLIQEQIAGARTDIAQAAEQLVTQPTDFQTVLDELISSLQSRVETLESEINREDVVAAIADNTTLSESEVEQAADRVIGVYEDLAATASAQLNDVEQAVTRAQSRIAVLQEQAVEQADRATEAVSEAAGWAFLALFIGAVIATLAGIAGTEAPVASRTRF
ncbi:hypothetical protein GCM10007989_08360 [Devosia pacifica]|uniref:CAP-Gly protein n=1 Tax=Devosia pacifica TaxID=1335967 RepID=A0A918RY55_9HYPH|nr:hypothetical protein [Devosia pacifica]GHA15849.1 hypothetical protein GCM10007989_08360 [Devosia pacifica]